MDEDRGFTFSSLRPLSVYSFSSVFYEKKLTLPLLRTVLSFLLHTTPRILDLVLLYNRYFNTSFFFKHDQNNDSEFDLLTFTTLFYFFRNINTYLLYLSFTLTVVTKLGLIEVKLIYFEIIPIDTYPFSFHICPKS